MRRVRRYFVECVNNDAHTNEVIAKDIARPEDAAIKKAEHGKTPRVWGISAEERDRFLRNRYQFNLKIRIYEEKQDGVLKLWRKPEPRRRLVLVIS